MTETDVNEKKIGASTEGAGTNDDDSSSTTDSTVEDVVADVLDFGETDEVEKNTEPSHDEIVVNLQREAEDWRAKAYRHAADLENARRRFNRERDELKNFGVEGLLRDMLPVVDNLDRALGHTEAGNSLAEGVELVLRQFVQMAAKYGAKPFEAKGEQFDPQLHEAMTQMPTADVAPGTVIEVFQRGWMRNDRLLRPAMVVVASEVPGAAPGATGETPSEGKDDNRSVNVDQGGPDE
jgi:molecular chaperone GrpE